MTPSPRLSRLPPPLLPMLYFTPTLLYDCTFSVLSDPGDQEASKSVKTVHSGFFANQGSVTTVEPASVGGGVGGKGKSSSSGEGAGKTADGDVIVRKKNKVG